MWFWKRLMAKLMTLLMALAMFASGANINAVSGTGWTDISDRAKTGPSQGRIDQGDSQTTSPAVLTAGDRSEAERVGNGPRTVITP